MKKIQLLVFCFTLIALMGCLGSETTSSDTSESSSKEESSTNESSTTESSSITESSSSETESSSNPESSSLPEGTGESSDTPTSSPESSESSEASSSSSSEPESSEEISSSTGGGIAENGAPLGSPVAKHGFITRDGNKLLGEHGDPVQLMGMSLFWSQWEGDFYNAELVKWLVDDWRISIIRAALGVDEENETPMGYVSYPLLEMKKIKKVIDEAIVQGIYVIVDWHDHRAYQHETEAIDFFEIIAKEYGHLPNIIYELYNEPQIPCADPSACKPHEDPNYDWDAMAAYQHNVIQAIRAIDKKNHISIGSPEWSSQPQVALESYKNGDISDPEENFSFSLHFYAGWHFPDTKPHRDNANKILEEGYVIFATEWGTSDPVTQEKVDEPQTREWVEWMKENKVSWCNWSITDKFDPDAEPAQIEANGALFPDADPTGNWTDADLRASGKLMREIIREANIGVNWDE